MGVFRVVRKARIAVYARRPTQADASHAAFINCRFTGANLGIDEMLAASRAG
jgi:hypothetical protein